MERANHKVNRRECRCTLYVTRQGQCSLDRTSACPACAGTVHAYVSSFRHGIILSGYFLHAYIYSCSFILFDLPVNVSYSD